MKTININKDGKKELKKHTSAIHCSNALSLLQRKISNALLFHAYSHLLDQEEHKISIKELCNYLMYRGHNYDAIKQALIALISTVIEWNLTDDNQEAEDWTASSMLASVNIKGAVCTYAYSPRMRQLLYSPSMYGKINLVIQSNFTSSYGLALYENCARYRNLPQTKVFSLELFRKIMGVREGKYTVFRDFKSRVIDKAVEEVNTLSDLIVKPNINKVGQKVASIYFEIQERKKKKRFKSYINIPLHSYQEETSNLIEKGGDIPIIKRMEELYGITKDNIEGLIKSYGIDKIENKIKQIESMPSFISGKVKNVAGLLIEALNKDYVFPKSSECLLREITKQKEEKNQAIREKDKNGFQIRKKYEQYIDEELIKLIKSLNIAVLDKIETHFISYLTEKNDIFILNKFKKDGLSNKIIRVFFKQFLHAFYPDMVSNFLTLEKFQK